MDTAIYVLRTFILVLLGGGGVESVALWSSIFVFALGCVLILGEARTNREE
jgi:hypothetical protein